MKKIDLFNQERLEFLELSFNQLQEIEDNLTFDSVTYKDLDTFTETRNILHQLLNIFKDELEYIKNHKTKRNWF